MKGRRRRLAPLGCPPPNPHLAPRGPAGLPESSCPWVEPQQARTTELGPAWRGPAGGPGPRGAWEGGREPVLPQEPRGKAPPWQGESSVLGELGSGSGRAVGVRMGGSPGRSPLGGAAAGNLGGWGPDVRSQQEWAQRGVPEPPPQEQTSKGTFTGLGCLCLSLPIGNHSVQWLQRFHRGRLMCSSGGHRGTPCVDTGSPHTCPGGADIFFSLQNVF